jgi:uncharacterized protein YkwD
MRMSGGLMVILFILLVPILLSSSGGAEQKGASSERELFEAVNRQRKTQGLPSLKWDQALARAARDHAKRMAQQRSVSHRFPGEPSLSARASQAGARFTWLAENVAEGPTAINIHGQFMKSAMHRDNILDTEMNSVGVGIGENKGQLFAVEDFSKAK